MLVNSLHFILKEKHYEGTITDIFCRNDYKCSVARRRDGQFISPCPELPVPHTKVIRSRWLSWWRLWEGGIFWSLWWSTSLSSLQTSASQWEDGEGQIGCHRCFSVIIVPCLAIIINFIIIIIVSPYVVSYPTRWSLLFIFGFRFGSPYENKRNIFFCLSWVSLIWGGCGTD